MNKLYWIGPSGLRFLTNLEKEDMLDEGRVACGSKHGLVIVSKRVKHTSKVEVLSFGDNGESQLGRGVELDYSHEPSPVLGISNTIVRVAAGESHSIGIDTEGKVWSWGGNAAVRGRQGPPSLPMRIMKGLGDQAIFITSVSCGREHSLAVDRTGRIFGWGNAANGRLGIASPDFVARPHPVVLSDDVCAVSIACGQQHSVMLSVDLRVFATGKTPATGLDRDIDRFSPVPALCRRRDSDPVQVVACGDNHTIVSTHSQILTFGDGSCGKLGSGNEEDRMEPALVKFNGRSFGTRRIAAGGYHSLVIEDEGQLWVFGLEQILRHIVVSPDDLSKHASRGPQTIALPKMFPYPVGANALDGRVSEVACGADFCLVVMTDLHHPRQQRSPIKFQVGSSSPNSRFLTPIPNALSETLFANSEESGLHILTLSNLLREEEKKSKELQKLLEGQDSLLAQLPHEYRDSPGKLIEIIANLKSKVAELEEKLKAV